MPDNDQPLLTCKNIRVSVPGRLLVDGLNLDVDRGEIVAVLGPNGTGKSLTLATIAGLRRPDFGNVTLNSQDIFLSPRQRTAQQLALLPQVVDDIFPATVLDTALVGRNVPAGFRRQGDVYTSSGYASAENQVDLEVAQAIGFVTIRRAGGR